MHRKKCSTKCRSSHDAFVAETQECLYDEKKACRAKNRKYDEASKECQEICANPSRHIYDLSTDECVRRYTYKFTRWSAKKCKAYKLKIHRKKQRCYKKCDVRTQICENVCKYKKWSFDKEKKKCVKDTKPKTDKLIIPVLDGVVSDDPFEDGVQWCNKEEDFWCAGTILDD